MATTPVTLTVDDTAKTLSASSPFALNEVVPIAVSLAALAAGASSLTLTYNSEPVAEADLTDGVGEIDLSTAEARALFDGLPPGYSFRVWAELWNEDEDRLIAHAYVTLRNTGSNSRASVRVAGAGEIQLTLAATLAAGAPVMLDDAHEAAACSASTAHRLIGILRTGGDSGDTARCVRAGHVAVADWGLTPGACYYLSHASPGTLTATAPDGYNLRPVGIALSSTVLALIDHPVVQSVASGTHYLAWDTATRRLMSTAPIAASAGAADASKIPMTDEAGLLDASFIPDVSAAAIAAHRAQFAALSALSDPTGPETVALLNAILSILKTGA